MHLYMLNLQISGEVDWGSIALGVVGAVVVVVGVLLCATGVGAPAGSALATIGGVIGAKACVLRRGSNGFWRNSNSNCMS